MHKTHPILYQIKHNFQKPKQNKSLTNYLFVLPDKLTISVLHTACLFEHIIFTLVVFVRKCVTCALLVVTDGILTCNAWEIPTSIPKESKLFPLCSDVTSITFRKHFTL